MVDQRVLEDLFAVSQPGLRDHLQIHGVNISMFTVSWLLCMFIEAPFSLNDSLLLWDYLFLFGDEVVFQVALHLLHWNGSKLLSLSSMGDILEFCLRSGIKSSIDIAAMLRSLLDTTLGKGKHSLGLT